MWGWLPELNKHSGAALEEGCSLVRGVGAQGLCEQGGGAGLSPSEFNI